MVQDLRLTFRLIAKERWFSAAAIVALALGIGVNAIGFTIVNAAFFRGLPFADADRLYVLTWQRQSGGRSNVSYVEFQEWRERSRAFQGLGAFTGGAMTISDTRGWPEELRGARVTANAFDLLPQQPLLGRGFAAGDDRKGAEPVVIISHSVWRNRYGFDPGVLGTPLRVNGVAATIIGVMPDSMRFPDNNEIWIPLVPTPDEERRDIRAFTAFGLLRDGASLAEAQAEMSGIGQQLAAADPEAYKELTGIRVQTFTERYVGGAARVLFLVIMGAVGCVLLIACANVANLLLSRSAFRTREMALRMAIGATRWRVIRQLLVENVVLGAIGGGLGLLLTIAGVGFFEAAIQDPGKPFWLAFTVDRVVFGYVAAICVLTAVLSGLAPALHVSKSNSSEILKEGGRGSAGSHRVRWFSGTLIVTELALTMVLLVGAGLMIRSFIKLYTLDIGIRTENLLTMRVRLPEASYADAEARRRFFERLEPRLLATPGVESVAVTNGVPPFEGGERLLEIDRNAGPSDAPAVFVSTVSIGPRFFETVGVALLRGRSFRETDGAPGAETVVINERLASSFFAGEDPIGRRLRFVQRTPAPGTPVPVWRTIVGISPTIRQGSVEDAYLNAVVYVPYRQDSGDRVSLLVRSALAPASVMDAVRREVQAIDPDQPVFALQTIEQMLAEQHWPFRAFGYMFVLFGVIALVLSAVGLYAVMAYSVTQRTQEIGVRMAVGAQTGQVSWLILKLGLVQLAIGLAIGLAGALAISRVLRRLLVEISPVDPVTFGGITILLTAVSVAACLVPARRATRVDPLIALRAE
jgi:putative ABC transport system permease protein